MIGTALRTFFHGRGDAVTRVVRPQSPGGDGSEVIWNVERGVIDAEGLEGHDLVIHLAGESIAGVWTAGKKRRIRESRVRGTSLLADALASLRTPPKALFSASGVDYYGDRGAEDVTERSSPGSGFLPEVVQEWEGATRSAQEAGIRVVMMRNGLVLSPRGGVLEVLLPLFRLGLGGRVGDGKQCWPWIALDEIPLAMAHLIDHPEVSGPVNFVAPEIVSNAEFTNRLAAAVNRPAFFALPAFAAKLAPGDMAEEMLLSSRRVRPERLEASGYRFRYPQLRPALEAMLS